MDPDLETVIRKASDAERADELLRGAKGKRLTYQQPREAANA